MATTRRSRDLSDRWSPVSSKDQQEVAGGRGVVDDRLDGCKLPALGVVGIERGLDVGCHNVWLSSSSADLDDLVLSHELLLPHLDVPASSSADAASGRADGPAYQLVSVRPFVASRHGRPLARIVSPARTSR